MFDDLTPSTVDQIAGKGNRPQIQTILQICYSLKSIALVSRESSERKFRRESGIRRKKEEKRIETPLVTTGVCVQRRHD